MSTRYFTGRTGQLADGTPSAMAKRPAGAALTLGPLGFAGDEQADRRFHGGPDQALHYYPAEHYAALAARFPSLQRFGPGDLGENLSDTGWLENDVRLGDVFALGDCRIAVTQPRVPCHKIAKRLDEADAPAFVADTVRLGWYYRVLRGGVVAPGTPLERVDSDPERPRGADDGDVVAVAAGPRCGPGTDRLACDPPRTGARVAEQIRSARRVARAQSAALPLGA